MNLFVPEHIQEIIDSKRKRSLYLKLRGGFGNQLFIYMAGLSLAYQNKLKLVIDSSGIDHLESIEELALPGEFRKSRVFWKLHYIFNSRNIDYECLNTHEKENLVNVITGNPTLRGFFQTPAYFAQLKNSGVNLRINLNQTRILFPNEVDSLSERNTALIHIRGGDFLEHRISIGILGQKYYENVFKRLEEQRVTRILIMSDDIEFAKKVLPTATFAKISYINRKDTVANFEYLSLFAFPDHIILSNSTFSWWGAQLAKLDCDVIAPETWSRPDVRRSLLNLNQWTTQPSIWF